MAENSQMGTSKSPNTYGMEILHRYQELKVKYELQIEANEEQNKEHLQKNEDMKKKLKLSELRNDEKDFEILQIKILIEERQTLDHNKLTTSRQDQQKVEKEIVNLKSEMQDLKESCEQYQNEVKMSHEKVSKQEQNIKNLEKNRNSLETLNQSLEKEHSVLKQTILTLELQIENLKNNQSRIEKQSQETSSTLRLQLIKEKEETENLTKKKIFSITKISNEQAVAIVEKNDVIKQLQSELSRFKIDKIELIEKQQTESALQKQQFLLDKSEIVKNGEAEKQQIESKFLLQINQYAQQLAFQNDKFSKEKSELEQKYLQEIRESQRIQNLEKKSWEEQFSNVSFKFNSEINNLKTCIANQNEKNKSQEEDLRRLDLEIGLEKEGKSFFLEKSERIYSDYQNFQDQQIGIVENLKAQINQLYQSQGEQQNQYNLQQQYSAQHSSDLQADHNQKVFSLSGEIQMLNFEVNKLYGEIQKIKNQHTQSITQYNNLIAGLHIYSGYSSWLQSQIMSDIVGEIYLCLFDQLSLTYHPHEFKEQLQNNYQGLNFKDIMPSVSELEEETTKLVKYTLQNTLVENIERDLKIDQQQITILKEQNFSYPVFEIEQVLNFIKGSSIPNYSNTLDLKEKQIESFEFFNTVKTSLRRIHQIILTIKQQFGKFNTEIVKQTIHHYIEYYLQTGNQNQSNNTRSQSSSQNINLPQSQNNINYQSQANAINNQNSSNNNNYQCQSQPYSIRSNGQTSNQNLSNSFNNQNQNSYINNQNDQNSPNNQPPYNNNNNNKNNRVPYSYQQNYQN